ncbi:MAG TPA: site-specific integrase [Pirellulales bacterium]|nr:site-specific integrase [Pirellulales bacterium]
MHTSNLRIARKRAAELDRKLAEGLPVLKLPNEEPKPVMISISNAIDDFVDYCKTEGCRRRTCTKYRGILTRFAEFAARLGVQQLDQVTVSLVDRYRKHRKLTLSPKSMHHEGQAVKAWLEWARTRGHIAANPLAEVHYTPPIQEPRGGPTLEQVNAILAAASERHRPILTLLAFTGARSGEVQRARVEDIDFTDNWFRIVSRPGAETKSGKSRKVPLHPRLRAVLEALPRRRDGYFFVAEASKKYPLGDHWISTNHLNEAFLGVLKSLGIPAGRDGGFTIHSLRHFFRTHCTNSRVQERVIDIWLGHAHDKSMGAVYYKLYDEQSQQFMAAVPFDEDKLLTDTDTKGERR